MFSLNSDQIVNNPQNLHLVMIVELCHKASLLNHIVTKKEDTPPCLSSSHILNNFNFIHLFIFTFLDQMMELFEQGMHSRYSLLTT